MNNVLIKTADEYLSNSISLEMLLSTNIENKHFDDIVLDLISTKQHWPERYTDDQFKSVLSIYRGIQKEKDANIELIDEWKNSH